ncbi:MAG: chromo domain-containing protein, partial [Chloroflexota bacterium]
PDPVAVAAADTDRWRVERIIAHRGSPRSRGTMRFRVRWKGFDAGDDTWEPWANVRQLAALQEYAAAQPSLSRILGLENEVV